MNQNNQILEHLKSGKPITPLDALKLYGCLRLSARIFDLREKGHVINKIIKEVGEHKHVAEYRLQQVKKSKGYINDQVRII